MDSGTKTIGFMKSVLYAGLVFLMVLLAAEIVMKLFFPYTATRFGDRIPDNEKRYGAGMWPGQNVTTINPDTGEVSVAPANNHGWRDSDRTYRNTKGSYRILNIGDSNTIGACAPADKIYSSVLEGRLRENGYNAESINISYFAWSTDQELEALKAEGVLYRPNLVVFYFCANDLLGNTYHTRGLMGKKPFYYDIKNGKPVRKIDPLFSDRIKTLADIESFRELILHIVSWSEILKRAHTIWSTASRGGYQFRDGSLVPIVTAYRVGESQIRKIRFIFGLDESDPLIVFLRDSLERKLTPESIIKAAAEAGLEENKDIILRYCENRGFRDAFFEDGYYPENHSVDSYEWRLYFLLMLEAKKAAEAAGARLAVVSDNEPGAMEWAVYWGVIPDNPAAREHNLEPSKTVERFARRNGIEFVVNRYKVARWRNDPHPSIEGHKSIADNIYEFLMENHGRELDRHRAGR